jgi:histidyl-tRNA synthetase
MAADPAPARAKDGGRAGDGGRARDLMRAPKGTRDVLPPESDRWIEVVARFADRSRRFGYGLVITPTFEHYEVFARIGASTDVVSKEMYDFLDKGGRRLALRPEGTAGTVRAYVEHRPAPPWKVWYLAPNFRYERPQSGRYRQHHQLGAEVLGVDDPAVEVEVMDLLGGFYRELGLRQTRLVINSMGDSESRARYRAVLLEHWRDHARELGDEIERAEMNPMRILDSKRPDWQEMIAAAPQLPDHLTDAAREQFAAVQSGLRAVGLPFEIEPRLVRGLDYYTSTLFEFRSDALAAGQDTIGGGGRLDNLAEELGGPPTPAIGFGSGIERILIVADAEQALAPRAARADVYVVDAIDAPDGVADNVVTALLHELRESGIAADRAYGGRSLKKQWGAADKSGARFGVMLAPREWSAGVLVVKDLRGGAQVEVRRDEVVAWLSTQLQGEGSR